MAAVAGTVQQALHERAMLFALFCQGDDGHQLARVLLHADGSVGYATPAARRLLREWFPGASGLPDVIRAWLGGGGVAQPLVLACPAQEGRRLTVRHRSVSDGEAVVSFTRASRAAHRHRLTELGLSKQQACVALELLDGQDPPAIARRMGISPRTVLKHLERVHARLDVHSRTQLLVRLVNHLGTP